MDRTIAKINQDIVLESDLAKVVARETGALSPKGAAQAVSKATPAMIRILFDTTLLKQAAKRQNIEVSDNELNQQVESMVAEIKKEFKSEKEFRAALAEESMSLEHLKSQLLERARLDYQVFRLVGKRFSVTESEARQQEAESAAHGNQETRIKLRRLAVPVRNSSEKACADVRERAARILEEGISFEDGVRKYSLAPGAKENGGEFEYMSLDKLAPDVRKAVENLQPGQATSPVISGGYASIFYVEGRRGARASLTERKFETARDQLLADLRRKANVQVFDTQLAAKLPPEYKKREAPPNNTAATAQTPPVRPR